MLGHDGLIASPITGDPVALRLCLDPFSGAARTNGLGSGTLIAAALTEQRLVIVYLAACRNFAP